MKTPKIFYPLFLLTLIGLVFSVLLLQLDYKVLFDATYQPSCNINAQFNCSAVAKSPYAFLFGIPVAMWGIALYIGILLYMWWGRQKYIYVNLLWVYFVFSLVSIVYFMISKSVLNTICLYCLVTYMVNWISTLILLIVWWTRGDYYALNLKPAQLHISQWGILLGGSGVLLLTGFLLFMSVPELSANPVVEAPDTLEGGYYDQQEMLGRFGKKDAAVKMILFSDYQCPFCAQFEAPLKEALTHFENIQLTRYEFPLDNQCNPIMGQNQLHENACQAAFLAKCAGVQGKFWEASALLHENHKFLNASNLDNIIQILKLDKDKMKTCMASKMTLGAVQRDIQFGLKKDLQSTPTYYINDKKYETVLPYPELKKALLEAGGKLKK